MRIRLVNVRKSFGSVGAGVGGANGVAGAGGTAVGVGARGTAVGGGPGAGGGFGIAAGASLGAGGGAEVLRGIDFDDEVSTLAVIGPSGGGKSTLLRIVGGLLEPTAGTVEVDGALVDYREEALSAYRAQLGFVFQNGGLFHHVSACENIALPLRVVHRVPEKEATERAHALLARFGLAAEADKLPARLSGGQQQRVAIARAIAARPKMLLLDEPTSALDPEYTNEVLDIVRDLKDSGTRFVIVTHEMGFARRACDKVAFLHDGVLLEYGPSASLFENPATPELQRFLSKLLEWSL